MSIPKKQGRSKVKMPKPRADNAWIRGYDRAMKLHGYETIRECRIFAMAYEEGFASGKRHANRKARVRGWKTL